MPTRRFVLVVAFPRRGREAEVGRRRYVAARTEIPREGNEKIREIKRRGPPRARTRAERIVEQARLSERRLHCPLIKSGESSRRVSYKTV